MMNLRERPFHQYSFNANCTSRGEFAVLVITPTLPPFTTVFGQLNRG